MFDGKGDENARHVLAFSPTYLMERHAPIDMEEQTGQSSIPAGCPSRDLLERHAFAAEDLTPLQREQVVDHLAVCESCAEAYLSFCQVDEQLMLGTPAQPAEIARSDEQILEGLWERVAAEEVVTGSRRAHWLPQRRPLVAMAASLLLALGLGVWWAVLSRSLGATSIAQSSPEPAPASPAQPSEDWVWSDPTLLLAEPAPFNPDKVDYGKWRDEHQAWFATMFPWVAEAQMVLDENGTHADYVDVLMTSGDMWQFRFDSRYPIGQRLAMRDPDATKRLWAYYSLAGARTGGTDQLRLSSSLLPSANRVGRDWRAALMVATTDTGRSRTEALLAGAYTLPYLYQTRCAAALWMRQKPNEATRLLQSDEYRSACAVPPHIRDVHAWYEHLRSQAVAAAQCLQTVHGLMWSTTQEDCVEVRGRDWERFDATLRLLTTDGEGE